MKILGGVLVKRKVLTAILCFFMIVATVTFSISLPFFIRPFYYAQIDSLDIVKATKQDKQTVKEAYDQVLDYITLPCHEFSTGVFPHSLDGKSHFEDFKALFMINISLLLISAAAIASLHILKYKKRFKPCLPFGLNPMFTSGTITLFAVAAVGVFAVTDFNRAFKLFHRIFFYGKENWLFDTKTDPIIYALPQEFFMNCAIFIAIAMVIICAAQIVFSLIQRKKRECEN